MCPREQDLMQFPCGMASGTLCARLSAAFFQLLCWLTSSVVSAGRACKPRIEGREANRSAQEAHRRAHEHQRGSCDERDKHSANNERRLHGHVSQESNWPRPCRISELLSVKSRGKSSISRRAFHFVAEVASRKTDLLLGGSSATNLN